MTAITFLDSNRLALLGIVAVLGAVYLALQRRRRHRAVRFTRVSLLASVAPRWAGWRRHVPAAMAALALIGLVLGLAHPVVERRVPKDAATVVLAIDTSASMDATDAEPTRLAAAVTAAETFIHKLPGNFRVGLVSFDRTAKVLAAPTVDHASVERAVSSLTTGPGTATGDGIYAALDALSAAGAADPTGKAAAIVLLSDGVPTVGRPVDEAIAAANAQKIPITTIAFGSRGAVINVQGRFVPVPADPDTMAMIAESTGGSFFEAFNSGDLRKVYDTIGKRVGYEVVQRDISMRFVTLGVVLLMIALGFGLLWAPRMVF